MGFIGKLQRNDGNGKSLQTAPTRILRIPGETQIKENETVLSLGTNTADGQNRRDFCRFFQTSKSSAVTPDDVAVPDRHQPVRLE
jgi:hypothetical protein